MSFNSFAQSILLKECGFDYKRDIQLQDSNYLKLEMQSEYKIAQQLTLSQSRTLSSVYNIPVVVHVLHLGEPVGTGTNISDAQIQSAITNLNDVYRGNTANSPIDFEIQFSLAQQDSNCNPHSGINRIDASSVPNYSTGGVDYYEDGGEADENTLKNLSRWPETEYFNIWIVSEIEDNDGGSGIQGYANFFYGSAYEGSVMMATVFGFDPNNNQPSYNLNSPRDNSTVVHEFGHYLHLHHTFKGDGDADQDGIGDSCAADITIGVNSDGCSDTEVHKRFTSQCKSGQLNDCTGAIFGDNTAKNYMSYAFCVDRLTSDQKTRSRAMLETTGISLIYSKGDEAPTNYSTTIANANCAPQTSSSGLAGHFTGIKNFKIDGIFTNTSSWTDTDGGYVDNTLNCQKVINVFEDSTYTFEVTTLAYANNVKGYIDFNNDGDFLDANEQILNLNTFDNNVSPYYSTVSQSYTIPSVNGSSIISGNKLRLRLNSDFGTVANACEAPQYGQVEDYTIIINELIANLTSDFSVSGSAICQGTTVSFTNLSTGANAYLWDFGDGNTSNLQTPSHTYSTAGTYDVSLTANSGTNTITETKTSLIAVNSNPIINPGLNQTICDGTSTTLNATSGQNYTVGVTAVNTSNYILSGAFSGNDPAINISLGDTLTFNVNSPGHPFLIKTTNTTGTANSVAVTNNGTSFGSIIWSPTVAGIYYYICEFHGGMVGTITVGSSNVNYTWDNSVTNGVAFNPSSTNIYTVTGTDGNGCFATDNVTVNLLANTTGTSVVTACGTYTWIDGLTYTATNNSATYTLTNSAGCDSVVTLNLTINQTLTGTAVISSCDSITWIDGITYTSSNNSSTYNLTNSAGCDSLVTLNLTINQSQTGTDVISSCDSITWIDGITYNSSNNTATYVTQTANGCDSVINLNLTINQSSSTLDVISSCDSITWIDGITYNSSNNSAAYTLTNLSGCDSVITLNLTINQSSSTLDVISSCDSITWIDGINYTSSNNTATYSLQNSLNCDSLVNLDLTINSSSSNFFTTTSCSSYIWNGQTLTASGIYVDTNVNSVGCPLTDSLNLTINNTPNVTTEVSCDSLIWNGTTYTTSGTYYTTGSSCVDSLFLTINNSNSSISNITSCDSLLWNGINYSNSGSYNFLTTNSNGCDSTATLILVINQTKGETDVISTCDSVNWIDGITYTSSNNSATYTLQTATGCDSIVTLNLTINSTIISSENITACNSYSWNGNTYNQSGTYYDSSLTASGCDSISNLNLIIDSVIITSQNINACNSYSWNGVTYNQSGTYYDSSLTASGCDSISTLNLTIDSVIITFQNISACNSYSWNGNTYSQSGTYLDSSLTAGGCDSVSTLILTINSSNTNNVSISACGSYSWNGVTYNQSGTYYDSLLNTFGCDSVTILSLTINQSTNNNIPISACNSYFWNGVTYTQSGTYVDSSTSSLGCDSIVTLNLTINNTYSNIDTVNSCNSYSWNGNTYTQSGIYYDSLSSLSGCDSVNILSLIISGNIFTVDTVAACQSYIWNGNQYDSSGVYIDTVLSSVACDSIQTLYLTINDDVTSPITLELLLDDYCLETFWSVKDSQDSVWYSGQNYNCNPSGGGAQANTTITEIMFLDPNDCYTFELNDYYGDGLGASVWNGTDGNWIIKDLNNIVIGQGQGDFGFIVEYSFLVGQSIVTSVIENQFSNADIAVYPNPFNESTTVKIQNIDGPHTIEVFDISGRIVKSLTTNSNEFTLDNISSSRGVYWLIVKNQSTLKPVKLIIE
jgi:plastocyanin/PDZ domain-containing secreted protein